MKTVAAAVISVTAVTSCMKTENSSFQRVVGGGADAIETPLENEEQLIDEAVEQARTIVEKNLKKNPLSTRDPHSKAFGCVRGKFSIYPEYTYPYVGGILAPNFETDSAGRVVSYSFPTYPAWVRFSSANPGPPGPDNSPSGLGMAIKLMNVPGRKLLKSESNAMTQDFVMVNNPVFPTGSIKDYLQAQRNPLLFAITNPRSGLILAGLLRKKNANPAEVRYWSMTAFKLDHKGMKYSAVPCESPKTPMPDNPSATYLRDNLEAHLKSRPACFNFMIQLYIDEKTTPIEDPSIEWKESDSPFVKIATLEIPPQQFRSQKQQEFCENLSFTPWHSVAEHRPLGSLNRVRKRVYEAVSLERHKNNGTVSQEPTGDETF